MNNLPDVNKHAAEFVRLMHGLGRIAVPDVVTWADRVIVASSDPPDWVFGFEGPAYQGIWRKGSL